MTASKRRRVGVMVARGDLGVEIGFERLAEVQEATYRRLNVASSGWLEVDRSVSPVQE